MNECLTNSAFFLFLDTLAAIPDPGDNIYVDGDGIDIVDGDGIAYTAAGGT